jgi:hypothetical protein
VAIFFVVAVTTSLDHTSVAAIAQAITEARVEGAATIFDFIEPVPTSHKVPIAKLIYSLAFRL